jgi:hypothetical protein
MLIPMLKQVVPAPSTLRPPASWEIQGALDLSHAGNLAHASLNLAPSGAVNASGRALDGEGDMNGTDLGRKIDFSGLSRVRICGAVCCLLVRPIFALLPIACNELKVLVRSAHAMIRPATLIRPCRQIFLITLAALGASLQGGWVSSTGIDDGATGSQDGNRGPTVELAPPAGMEGIKSVIMDLVRDLTEGAGKGAAWDMTAEFVDTFGHRLVRLPITSCRASDHVKW